MNKILKYVIDGVCIAAIGTGLVVGNQVLKQFETEIDTALTPKIVDSSQVDVSSQNGQALSKRIMEEGAVLLHNENNTLPLNYNDKRLMSLDGDLLIGFMVVKVKMLLVVLLLKLMIFLKILIFIKH